MFDIYEFYSDLTEDLMNSYYYTHEELNNINELHDSLLILDTLNLV
jgi:hypothetical protein